MKKLSIILLILLSSCSGKKLSLEERLKQSSVIVNILFPSGDFGYSTGFIVDDVIFISYHSFLGEDPTSLRSITIYPNNPKATAFLAEIDEIDFENDLVRLKPVKSITLSKRSRLDRYDIASRLKEPKQDEVYVGYGHDKEKPFYEKFEGTYLQTKNVEVENKKFSAVYEIRLLMASDPDTRFSGSFLLSNKSCGMYFARKGEYEGGLGYLIQGKHILKLLDKKE